MTETLVRTSPALRQGQLFIGGDWVDPSSTRRFDVYSPATEQIYARVAEAQSPDVERAIAAARHAFDRGPWGRMRPTERAVYLRRIAARLAERRDQLAEIWVSEVGITHAAAYASVGALPSIFEFYAGLADSFPFEESKPSQVAAVGMLVREPVGVVGAIIPWNAPFSLIAWKIAPALIAGCTVILKMSPEAPTAGYVMAEIMQDVGLPEGVFNMLTADREASELLVRDPRVDKITFTGSSAAGRTIASLCGSRVARCTLELGGKSAAVVLDDYDVVAAANALSNSARLMTGQVCASLTRVIVSRKRHDALLEAMAHAFGAIRVGDPFSADTDMGPLAMERQRERVEGYIAKGQAEGATLAVGGRRPGHLSCGYFVEPTVFGNVDNSMTIAREEIFGPVVSVIPADDEEQATDIANDTIFGLGGAVFTNDADRAYRVCRGLRTGTVSQNRFRADFFLAFGGFKQSGLGREGGVEGLLPFLEVKTLLLDEAPSHLGAAASGA